MLRLFCCEHVFLQAINCSPEIARELNPTRPVRTKRTPPHHLLRGRCPEIGAANGAAARRTARRALSALGPELDSALDKRGQRRCRSGRIAGSVFSMGNSLVGKPANGIETTPSVSMWVANSAGELSRCRLSMRLWSAGPQSLKTVFGRTYQIIRRHCKHGRLPG